MEAKERTPVFVYKLDPSQSGNGIYRMVACFPTLEVHVLFTFLAHSENDYLQDVGEETPCDGSCERYKGFLRRQHTDYDVGKIIEKAMAYAERQGNPK